MDGQVVKLPLGEEEGAECLDLEGEEFPVLVDALQGPEREPLIEELSRLLGRYLRPRAERWATSVLARLVFVGFDGNVEHVPAIVEDISMTGVRLAVNRTTRIDLAALAAARVQLIGEIRGGELQLDIPSWFVRVGAVNDATVSLAFRFETLESDQAETLEKLRVASTPRPSLTGR